MNGDPPVTVRGAVTGAVATMDPGYFAYVMGTGIISVGVRNHGLTILSDVLFWLAAGGYVLLLGLTIVRLFLAPSMLRAEFNDPSRGFRFFTFVAGTAVLGTRLTLSGYQSLPLALLAIAWCTWTLLGYVVPWTAVLGREDRPVIASANGTWFIWVVASQSVAVLSAALEPSVRTGRRELALVAVFSWSVGVFLYGAAGIFVAARMLIYPLRPIDLTPPYWVAMGATAITVLAGARIVQMADAPMVAATRGLVAGCSVVFWAFGTWLIPVLVAAGWWRHVTHRVPLRYEPTLWSIVFPLGMYGVAGHYLGSADHLPIVRGIGENETWIALVVWALTFVAMIAHLARSLILEPHAAGKRLQA
jgi:tellurite resistance protein TehA-like permease